MEQAMVTADTRFRRGGPIVVAFDPGRRFAPDQQAFLGAAGRASPPDLDAA